MTTPVRVDTLVLDVVVPVFNEEHDLGPSVRRLHAYLEAHFPFSHQITIADNASTDQTPLVAAQLADELPRVRLIRLEEKGRGRALRHSWSTSDAAVLAYLDVDMSTDLAALLPLVAPLITGHSDLAIGSRLDSRARVIRGAKREFISRAYNQVLRRALAARFSDAQCGFKAIRADIARDLLPLVRDTGWFFDTELLVLAQNIGLRIHEVPVDWKDDPDSRVDILSTAIADLKGVARMGKALLTGAVPLARLRAELGRTPLGQPPTGVQPGLLRQMVRFAAVGIASTAAYLVLFLVLGPVIGAQAANLVALLLTAIANTAANRRLTFGIRGGAEALRHQVQGLVIFALGFIFTSSSLALLHLADPLPSRITETAVLVGANLLATLVRFILFRVWVFGQVGPAKTEERLLHTVIGEPRETDDDRHDDKKSRHHGAVKGRDPRNDKDEALSHYQNEHDHVQQVDGIAELADPCSESAGQTGALAGRHVGHDHQSPHRALDVQPEQPAVTGGEVVQVIRAPEHC